VVSGLDFSEPAIAAASSLAASLGLPATFVVENVYDAVAAFGGRRFDIVYTGIGALVWLSDVLEWARVVAGLLVPGRFLYLVEGHPLAQILDSGKVPLTGGPPRDHGASGAPARQMPVPQHPEGPASRTRASAGEGGDASRRPCFRRSAGTAAAHRSRPGS
jgi:hypothetical protein